MNEEKEKVTTVKTRISEGEKQIWNEEYGWITIEEPDPQLNINGEVDFLTNTQKY